MSDIPDPLPQASVRQAAAALVADVFRPLLEEFRTVLEEEDVFLLRDGYLAADPAAGSNECRLRYRAYGTAPGGRLFEIGLAAAATDAGAIELSADCFDDAQQDGLTLDSPPPLADLPRQTLPAAPFNREPARQWCAEVLKQCAEAIVEANFDPAAPAPALADFAVPAGA